MTYDGNTDAIQSNPAYQFPDIKRFTINAATYRLANMTTVDIIRTTSNKPNHKQNIRLKAKTNTITADCDAEKINIRNFSFMHQPGGMQMFNIITGLRLMIIKKPEGKPNTGDNLNYKIN